MNIIQMSISAAILILAIVVIRALVIHKLPKKTFLVLWSVVLIRLMVPFSIPAVFGTNAIVDRMAELFTGKPNTQIVSSNRSNQIADNSLLPNTNSDVLSGTNTADTLVPTATPKDEPQMSPVLAIWIIGMMVCALFFVATHLRCRREYKAALPVENGFVEEWLLRNKTSRLVQIKQSDRITVPMTYGISKPIILFPKTTDWRDEAQIRYVLTHELTHIKRLDILTKWLLAAALCAHWCGSCMFWQTVI